MENEEDKNCELLFEYLRSILYDSKIKTPALEDLDENHRKLGEGLKILQQSVEEMKAYSEDLSKGNLSGFYPSRDNLLCGNLKNLHANLNHLTWQAKQVAAGDYSQHVSYLGEFSEAFNTMIEQLKEREALLRDETEKVKKRARVIEEYNRFLMEMSQKKREWILVVDAETREILHCNKQESEGGFVQEFCACCAYNLAIRQQLLDWQGGEQYSVWEAGDEDQRFYRITSFHVEWRGRSAYAHIVEDVTADKRAAYYDAGTGIHNRLFFEEHMAKLLLDKNKVVLCYMDLDGLKYVNDNYGHNEGDFYMRAFVLAIRQAFRSTDVFARVGGDEFCLVLPNARGHLVEQKILKIRDDFMHDNKQPYPVSFSFGVVEIDGAQRRSSLKEILEQADSIMYDYKKKHKRNR